MAANGHKYSCEFYLGRFFHVFMLPTFKAYKCQQYVCVLSAILATTFQGVLHVNAMVQLCYKLLNIAVQLFVLFVCLFFKKCLRTRRSILLALVFHFLLRINLTMNAVTCQPSTSLLYTCQFEILRFHVENLQH